MNESNSERPASRWLRMLDWWLAPRWRALLTWVALAGLSTWGVYVLWDRISREIWRFTNTVNSISPVAFPASFNLVAHLASAGLFAWWYEPFVLRLNFTRGVVWLFIRIGCVAAFSFFTPRSSQDWWHLGAVYFVPSTMLMAVLWGWRSRPWIPMVCATLGAVLYNVEMHPWTRAFGCQFIDGVLLLYGTRLLTGGRGSGAALIEGREAG